MMNFDLDLYRKLLAKRTELKQTGKLKDGKAPVICTDDALRRMAELCPKTLNDFYAVDGIGKTFVERYGQDFLDIILQNTEAPMEQGVALGDSAINTLKELEKKLVNLNRRNRLLYMPKTANKYAVDMFSKEGELDPLNIIFGEDQFTVISNIGLIDLEDEYSTSSNTSKHRRYQSLLREANKEIREKGQNNLYIAYPFVEGRLPGENFDVRAPLVLFPIEGDLESTKISIRLDQNRDILYNTTLVLAYYKFNNIRKSLPQGVIEDAGREGFFDNICTFYDNIGLKIQVPGHNLEKFTEYRSGEFPKYKEGELILHPNIVMGRFPIRSSSLQKDFDEILDRDEINRLLNDLLLTTDEIDYYSDSYSGIEKEKINDRALELSERNILYINDLNSSQENVLSAMDKLDELVIQGPPGTGKSQTITSLISEFAAQEKTVLMVSEKKTALDVVYSRLGNISKYALLIDDVENKELFYRQMNNILLNEDVDVSCVNLIDELSDKIDEEVRKLSLIADKLYAVSDFGIEPYKVFLECEKIDVYGSEKEKFSSIRQNSKELIAYDYKKNSEMKTLFKEDMSEMLQQYVEAEKEYPVLKDIRKNMADYELLQLEDDLMIAKEAVDTWKTKNFLMKLFTKSTAKRAVSEFVTKYFDTNKGNAEKGVFDNSQYIRDSLEKYQVYQQFKPLYDKLTLEEREYFRVLLMIREQYKNFEEANNALYNALLYMHITKFRSDNVEVFNNIDCFDNIVDEISALMAEKKKITKRHLRAILNKDMNVLTQSKRSKEIRRALESKRKWSVNKFINKFSFEIFNGIKIWLMTPEVVSEILPLQKGLFDLVIFDEASQMYVEKGIPSIFRGKKVVIAGDHKQLRPSALGVGRMEIDEDAIPEDADVSAALEEESLLDLARFKYQDVMLNFHYRSKYEELIAFSNYAFYHGRLYVSPNAVVPEKPPIEVHKLEDGKWIDRCNRAEAKYIVELLKNFFETRKENETVGVITFNVNQRDLIDDMIDIECSKEPAFAASIRTELNRKQDGEDIGLFVKNIESVQGDERDVIIFSIGYARNENGRIVRNFGWLNQRGGENRLNVAISRAKKKVHIVTSLNAGELQVEDTKNDGPKILKKYLQYAEAVSARDSETAKQILQSFGDTGSINGVVSFDSDFEEQVYNALVGRGYKVDTQVGIGGYSIDLAIRHNGKYVLGIECDGRLYHSSKSARERDYYRQKYLESRGWRIHRIWSTNWWNNPSGEIEKICTIVNSLAGVEKMTL